MMEHRHHTRAPIELEVGYKRLNSFFAEYTRNISKGGTFIKTKKPLPAGTRLLFRLVVPTCPTPFQITGEVVRDEAAYQSLMSFTRRGERTVTALEDNLDALKHTWPISRYFD